MMAPSAGPATRADPGSGTSSTGWTDLEWESPAPAEASAAEWTDLPMEPSGSARPGVFARLFAGRFGRLLLPAIVAQSLLIGGGYATGREVVEFGGRFGAIGWLAVLTIFLGFSLVSILVYEFARVMRAYDYKSFMQGLIGPAWPAFDLLYAAMAVLVIAVMASATGTIIEATLGVPALVGILGVVLVLAVLIYHGAHLIEAFKTIGTTLLYLGYAIFGVLVLVALWPEVVGVFTRGDTQHAPGAGPGSALWAGVLYVGYNLVLYPAVLFTLHRQGRTRDSVIAGIVSGLTMTLPFLLTYLCVLAFYSTDAVVGADVPWLAMLDAVGGPWVVGAFGVVMGWTLLETSVGLVHAILDRIERAMDKRATRAVAGRRLARWHKGGLAAVALLVAAGLAQVGITDLVAVGYTWMGYAFLVLFALPLLTIGVLKIVSGRGSMLPGSRDPGVKDAVPLPARSEHRSG